MSFLAMFVEAFGIGHSPAFLMFGEPFLPNTDVLPLIANRATECRASPIGAVLHWHGALLMCAPDYRDFLAVPGDHTHALIEPGGDVRGRTALQEGNAVLAAGGEDAVARLLHLGRIGIAP